MRWVYLERVASLCEQKSCDSEPHGHSLFNLARSLVATDGDKDRAIKLAKKAQTIFEKTPKAFGNELVDVDVWLKKHDQSHLKKLISPAVPLKQVRLSITNASHKPPAGDE